VAWTVKHRYRLLPLDNSDMVTVCLRSQMDNTKTDNYMCRNKYELSRLRLAYIRNGILNNTVLLAASRTHRPILMLNVEKIQIQFTKSSSK
jgi:hypothetical protein